jgi:molybdopterin-guanine dinucleotide biosynthesis protein A
VLCTGAVLAGGRSRRMGQDKALLAFGSATLLSRTVALVRSVVGETVVVGRNGVPDLVPGTGPLGGLLTALKLSPGERVLVVACDMPFLSGPFLTYLVGLGGDVVVPADERGFHPLHAVYSKSVLPVIEEQLELGRYRLQDLIPRLEYRAVRGDELARFTIDGRNPLLNVNDPVQFQEALRLAGF